MTDHLGAEPPTDLRTLIETKREEIRPLVEAVASAICEIRDTRVAERVLAAVNALRDAEVEAALRAVPPRTRLSPDDEVCGRCSHRAFEHSLFGAGQCQVATGCDCHEFKRTVARAVPSDPPYQSRVQEWMQKCFGPVIAKDQIERNYRFLEEALELVQSLGCTEAQARRIVEYVYSRPVGDVGQEIGGVMVTLAALCTSAGKSLDVEAETELARVWTAIDKIRAKQASKHERGVGVDNPLP